MSSSSSQSDPKISRYGFSIPIFNHIIKSLWVKRGKGKNEKLHLQDWSEEIGTAICGDVQERFKSLKLGRDCTVAKIKKVWMGVPGRPLFDDEIQDLARKEAQDAILAESKEKKRDATEKEAAYAKEEKRKLNKRLRQKDSAVDKANKIYDIYVKEISHKKVYGTIFWRNKVLEIITAMLEASNGLNSHVYEQEVSDLQIKLLDCIDLTSKKCPIEPWAVSVIAWSNNGKDTYTNEMDRGDSAYAIAELIEDAIRSKVKRKKVQSTQQGVVTNVSKNEVSDMRYNLKRKLSRGANRLVSVSKVMLKDSLDYEVFHNKYKRGQGSSREEQVVHDKTSQLRAMLDGDSDEVIDNYYDDDDNDAIIHSLLPNADEFEKAQQVCIDYIASQFIGKPLSHIHINTYDGVNMETQNHNPVYDYNDGSNILEQHQNHVWKQVYKKSSLAYKS